MNWPMARVIVLGGEGQCWNKNESLLEKVFLTHKDMVSIVCSLDNNEVCGATEIVIFEPGFNEEKEPNKQRGLREYSRIAKVKKR